jgi:serine/threonine protein kinase
MSVFPKPGEIFDGRYQLLDVLGSGGLGTVFRALQIDCGRQIALKILYSPLSDQDESRERFLREARALGRLNHIGIVTVYHIAVSETGFAYIAMELLRGTTLRSLLNEERLASLRALKITRQVADTLSYVHENGIVHRDIKPENIILAAEPEPDTAKLVDFGLVRLEQEQKLTSTGMLIGSVNYMSPEQCQGKVADSKSDVYSLTVCLYEMLSGSKPFQADTPIGLLYKHQHEKVPEIDAQQVDRFHQRINEVISKGMAKSPDERYQNMAEFSEALSTLSSTLERVVARNLRQPRFVRLFQHRTLLGFLALALVGSGFLCLLRSNSLREKHTSLDQPEKGREALQKSRLRSQALRLKEHIKLLRKDLAGGMLDPQDTLIQYYNSFGNTAIALSKSCTRAEAKIILRECDGILTDALTLPVPPRQRILFLIRRAQCRLELGKFAECNSDFAKALAGAEVIWGAGSEYWFDVYLQYIPGLIRSGQYLSASQSMDKLSVVLREKHIISNRVLWINSQYLEPNGPSRLDMMTEILKLLSKPNDTTGEDLRQNIRLTVKLSELFKLLEAKKQELQCIKLAGELLEKLPAKDVQNTELRTMVFEAERAAGLDIRR